MDLYIGVTHRELTVFLPSVCRIFILISIYNLNCKDTKILSIGKIMFRACDKNIKRENRKKVMLL